MAHSIAASPTTSLAPIPPTKKASLRVLAFDHQGTDHAQSTKSSITFPDRRRLVCGTAAAVLSLVGGGIASAAGRRPPPSPPTEKQDPNVSGVQAKILASKKRKEAMEQAMAKLREKGKPINPAPPPPPPPPSSPTVEE